MVILHFLLPYSLASAFLQFLPRSLPNPPTTHHRCFATLSLSKDFVDQQVVRQDAAIIRALFSLSELVGHWSIYYLFLNTNGP